MPRACFDINKTSTLLLEGWEAALGMVVQQHPTSENTQKTLWKHLEPPPVSQKGMNILWWDAALALSRFKIFTEKGNSKDLRSQQQLYSYSSKAKGASGSTKRAGRLRWPPSEFCLNEQPPIASYNTNTWKETCTPAAQGCRYHFTWKMTRSLTLIEAKNHLQIPMKNLTLSKNKHMKILLWFLAIISSVYIRDMKDNIFHNNECCF